MTELKPCPFCGSNEITIIKDTVDIGGFSYVECLECHATSSWIKGDNYDKWNTRQPAFDWKPIEELTAECGDVLLINDTNTYDIGCRRGNRVVVLVSRRDSEPYEQDFRLDYFTNYALLTPPEVK